MTYEEITERLKKRDLRHVHSVTHLNMHTLYNIRSGSANPTERTLNALREYFKNHL